MVGLGGKQTLTPARLRTNVRRYRRRKPAATTGEIARHFGISRQLAHKILKAAGLATRARRSDRRSTYVSAGKRFYKFVERARGVPGKVRVAAGLGITTQALWRYELPPEHPKHRDMPEGMREKYKKLVDGRSK